ncbi:MAG: pentapeptide repeat-containing protein [Chloroflexi bacterium]|nr:pentapeptide repeat-containing protein [Chloroflexota bacterium]
MKDADLSNADLRGLKSLQGVNLQNANLSYAKFEDTNMRGAILTGAHLFHAELKSVVLDEASLSCANLMYAKLNDVRMGEVDLRGAYMTDAHLNDTRFRYLNAFAPGESPSYLEEIQPAILPDGTRFNNEVDIEKFTNTNHPQFGTTLEDINRIRRNMGHYVSPNVWLNQG